MTQMFTVLPQTCNEYLVPGYDLCCCSPDARPLTASDHNLRLPKPFIKSSYSNSALVSSVAVREVGTLCARVSCIPFHRREQCLILNEDLHVIERAPHSTSRCNNHLDLFRAIIHHNRIWELRIRVVLSLAKLVV